MKIAVTSQDRKTITAHAGLCRKFWIYDVEENQVVSRTLLELPREQSFHECHSDGPHPLDTVDVFIAGGMGTGLANRLARRGVRALATSESDPDRAVAAFVAGQLDALAPQCHEGHGHHQHQHQHQHGNGSGCGCG